MNAQEADYNPNANDTERRSGGESFSETIIANWATFTSLASSMVFHHRLVRGLEVGSGLTRRQPQVIACSKEPS